MQTTATITKISNGYILTKDGATTIHHDSKALNEEIFKEIRKVIDSCPGYQSWIFTFSHSEKEGAVVHD